jgi:hypothetical protein
MIHSVNLMDKTMNILDKFLNIFNRQRSTMLGAMAQPNDLMTHVNTVRARAYLKITGKQLVLPPALSEADDAEDITKKLSPTRRLARKSI